MFFRDEFPEFPEIAQSVLGFDQISEFPNSDQKKHFFIDIYKRLQPENKKTPNFTALGI
jgi:hypothetical protein